MLVSLIRGTVPAPYFPHEFCRKFGPLAAPQILGASDGFQMIGVHTRPIHVK